MEERHVPRTVLPTDGIHPCPKMDRAFCLFSVKRSTIRRLAQVEHAIHVANNIIAFFAILTCFLVVLRALKIISFSLAGNNHLLFTGDIKTRLVFMTSTDIIGATIAPVVVINAIGLLGLVMQNRYSRVKDRIYRLIRERDELLEQPLDNTVKVQNTKKLLKKYLKEAKLIKNAMLFAFLSIVFIVATCFLIMVSNYLFSGTGSSSPFDGIYAIMEVCIILIFCIGLVMLLLSVISMSRSLMISIATVSFEISAESIIDQ
ncbi:MAG: DUF2721 domain-containing protein [Candidatus Hodarchaeales archaeon]